MRLLSARVHGFQSFADSGIVEFADGINLLVGQNNAGKSAFLRALQPAFADDRHRNAEKWEQNFLASPEVDLVIEVSGEELIRAHIRSSDVTSIPIPTIGSASAILDQFESGIFQMEVKNRPSLSFTAEFPSHKLFDPIGNQTNLYLNLSVRERSGNATAGASPSDNIPQRLYEMWSSEMLFFTAERLSVGEGPAGHTDRLLPNAANLAAFLHTLAGDRGDLVDALVKHLREIFPTVGHLSTRLLPATAGQVEIRVWPTPQRARVEHSFPLNMSGTGVAQMIALLAAVMTMDKAVIIIDEINSFLHPAAVKSLLRILQTEYSHHQYIMSTHAPEVIGFARPSTIHLVRRSGYESTIERLNTSDVAEFRKVAKHLGVSMADVFAAERVIWVEGETEETLFPFLYRRLVGEVPHGTVFTAVVAVGDLSRKRTREVVYQVYNRLSSAVAVMPIKVTFGFDSEGLSEAEKNGMVSDSGGRLHFLPRRMVECYLLNPAAIAYLINEKDEKDTTNAQSVSDEISTQACSPQFGSWTGAIDAPEWLTQVDAAKLIDATIGVLTDHRVRFDKTKDVIELAKFVLEHEPQTLKPLSNYVTELVQAVQSA